jgi:hypothetical protein
MGISSDGIEKFNRRRKLKKIFKILYNSNMETLLLTAEDDSILPILENFLDRPRKLKYDMYNGKIYHVVWDTSALQLRRERLNAKKKEEYASKEITPYISRKMGIPVKARGRPKKQTPFTSEISAL